MTTSSFGAGFEDVQETFDGTRVGPFP